MKPTSTNKRPRRKWLPYFVVLGIVLAVAAIGYWLAVRTQYAQMAQFMQMRGRPPGASRSGGTNNSGGKTSASQTTAARPASPGGFQAPPMPVGIATAVVGDVKIILNGLGSVTPLRNVTVGAQVAGQLLSVKFDEGQMVKQGDLLAEIDPRTYQAALEQAQGALARDAATLVNAKTDLARYQTLFEQDSIARQQLDSQKSLVHQYEGTLSADAGTVAAAKVNLAYTKIIAPIGGRAGLRAVDPGNNVSIGSAIVTITQLKPVNVLFTIAEDNLPAVVRQLRAGNKLPVEAWDRGLKNKLADGVLVSLDNAIDVNTGTVKAKAEFANADESLFANQFVNVRVLLDTLRGATVIPTSALQHAANGLFVYVVDPADKTVSQRLVTTGPTEGERVAVSDGVKPGEIVVTDGIDTLREGSVVELPAANASTDAGAPAHAAAPAPSPDAQKRQWNGGAGQGQRRRNASADGAATQGKPEETKPADAKPAAAKPEQEKKQ